MVNFVFNRDRILRGSSLGRRRTAEGFGQSTLLVDEQPPGRLSAALRSTGPWTARGASRYVRAATAQRRYDGVAAVLRIVVDQDQLPLDCPLGQGVHAVDQDRNVRGLAKRRHHDRHCAHHMGFPGTAELPAAGDSVLGQLVHLGAFPDSSALHLRRPWSMCGRESSFWRYSTAAAMSPVFHAVQSSRAGNPRRPVRRPSTTTSTAALSEPLLLAQGQETNRHLNRWKRVLHSTCLRISSVKTRTHPLGAPLPDAPTAPLLNPCAGPSPSAREVPGVLPRSEGPKTAPPRA